MFFKEKLFNKIKEWFKRYILSEIVSYSLAMFWWTFVFYITKNYYISWICVIIWDFFWYYATILIKEIIYTKSKYWTYNYKLFLKDLRNLSFEFGFPIFFEIFVIYPTLVFYIPRYFNNYTLWIFIAMTLAVAIFYCQAIVLYEIRKKIFN